MVRARSKEIQEESQNQTLELARDDISDEYVTNYTLRIAQKHSHFTI